MPPEVTIEALPCSGSCSFRLHKALNETLQPVASTKDLFSTGFSQNIQIASPTCFYNQSELDLQCLVVSFELGLVFFFFFFQVLGLGGYFIGWHALGYGVPHLWLRHRENALDGPPEVLFFLIPGWKSHSPGI